MIEPLRLSFDVECAAEHAFGVRTDRISQWWPRSHSVSGDDGLVMVLEPRPGGRIYERTSAGVEHDWGEVTVWEPPRRLGYLWHLRRDRADATDVVIDCVDAGGSTRVEIRHASWERLGAEGHEWRDRNRAGWGGLLPHFSAACSEP